MPLRHQVVLALTGAIGAAAVLCPLGHAPSSADLGSIVSAAPPLFEADAAAASEDAALTLLRQQAGVALGQLRSRETP